MSNCWLVGYINLMVNLTLREGHKHQSSLHFSSLAPRSGITSSAEIWANCNSQTLDEFEAGWSELILGSIELKEGIKFQTISKAFIFALDHFAFVADSCIPENSVVGPSTSPWFNRWSWWCSRQCPCPLSPRLNGCHLVQSKGAIRLLGKWLQPGDFSGQTNVGRILKMNSAFGAMVVSIHVPVTAVVASKQWNFNIGCNDTFGPVNIIITDILSFAFAFAFRPSLPGGFVPHLRYIGHSHEWCTTVSLDMFLRHTMPWFILFENICHFTTGVWEWLEGSPAELGSKEVKVAINHGIEICEVWIDENRITKFVLSNLFIVLLSAWWVSSVDVIKVPHLSVIHTDDTLIGYPVWAQHRLISLKHSAAVLHHEF